MEQRGWARGGGAERPGTRSVCPVYAEMLRLLQKKGFKFKAAPREIGEQISHHLSPGSTHRRPPFSPVNTLSLSPSGGGSKISTEVSEPQASSPEASSENGR